MVCPLLWIDDSSAWPLRSNLTKVGLLNRVGEI